MDELFPEKNYNPEDEYEPLEGDSADDSAASQTTDDADDDIPVIEPPTRHTMPSQSGYAPYGQPQPYQQNPQQPYRQPQNAQPVYPPYPPYPQQPVQQYPQQPHGSGYAQPYYPAPPQGYMPQYQPQQPVNQRPAPNMQDRAQTQSDPVPPLRPVQQNVPAGDNPYTSNPYTQRAPVQQNGQQAAGYGQRPQKQPTSTGTKVFIIILCAILAALLIGFIVYISATASGNKSNSNNDNNNNSFNIDDNGGSEDSPGFTPFGFNNSTGSYEDVEDELTLVEDKGETQKRGDDNPDSVGEPDEKAKNITLEALPKDKDNEKYTKQSSYDTVSESVVTVELFKEKITDNEKDIIGSGTGTIISADGYIVTNAHVLGNSKIYAVNIVTNSGDNYQAKIIGYDTWTDLAVLKVDAKNLKPVTFGDSELVNVGDDVIAIGSPGGVKFQNSLTQGIVSAVDRELTINRYVRYIQSDAAISPGNSGGPLCNIYGQVIGITTAKTVATYYESMSFSIPSATVEEIIGDLMRYGYVKGRTRIGFSGTEVSEEEVYYYNYPTGVIVGEIDESGALAGTSIKKGDIITELDGEEITSFQDIYDVLADHKPGDKIKIKALRPGN